MKQAPRSVWGVGRYNHFFGTFRSDVDECFALIWSDRVNSAMFVDVFVVASSQGQSEQQPGQVKRRRISLIFAGRNRIIMIRRELPLTVIASPIEPVA